VALGGSEMDALLERMVPGARGFQLLCHIVVDAEDWCYPRGAMLTCIGEPSGMRRLESPSRVARQGEQVVRSHPPMLDCRVER
jgi:hypothetical protein